MVFRGLIRWSKSIFSKSNYINFNALNTIIKETETFTIEYDAETNSILHTINRFLVTDEWKDLLTSGHAYFSEHKLSKWISDNRDLPIVHNNIDGWLYNQWLPSMLQTGWKQWALVEPQTRPGKANQQIYQQNFARMGVEVKSFDCLDEAKEWIK